MISAKMSIERTLRIFCPIHEASFEVTENSKVFCEITGHVLSGNFPHAEFWEFCCNCETFSPSKLGKGEKARKTCYGCQNEITARFACDSCKTFSFECGAQAKGKKYFVTYFGIEPSCPGCTHPSNPNKVVQHECKDIDTAIFTSHETCPFCLEATALLQKPAGVTTEKFETVCPVCRSAVGLGSVFCQKCSYQLRTDIVVDRPGSDITRSRLLGSLCPNCSTPLQADSEFCGECGQAIVASIPPPPPPPPPKKRIAADASYAPPTVDSPVKPVITTPKPQHTFKVLAAVGVGLVVLLAISSIIPTLISGPGPSGNLANNSMTPAGSPATPLPTPSVSSGLPYSFDRQYHGFINAKSMSMSLVKDGENLTGSVTVNNNYDTLRGKIDSAGGFTLDGYENDVEFTGLWSGTVYNDGTISGKWTKRDGKTSERRFSATEQKP